MKSIFRRLSRSILLNPIWITEHYLDLAIRREARNLALGKGDVWLDIGCGTRPYEGLFASVIYIGVDVPESGRPLQMKQPDVFYDGVSLPFPDGSVDGIFCTQVLEHVPSPVHFLTECSRVLKPGGRCLFSIPFVWEEHEEPHDYFRFTSFGVRSLFAMLGFDTVSLHKTTGSLETIAQAASAHLANHVFCRNRFIFAFLKLLFCFPIQTLGLAFQRLLPQKDAQKLYLDAVVVAKKRIDTEFPG